MTLSPNRKILLLLVLSLIVVGFSAVSLALINHMITIPSLGKIEYPPSIGIYQDSSCSEKVTSLDWGVAEPGLTRNETIYIRNEGSAPTILYLNTTNWNPQEASNYITLSWDYNEEAIEQKHVVQVTLTLSISSSIEGITTFAFDIIISQS